MLDACCCACHTTLNEKAHCMRNLAFAAGTLMSPGIDSRLSREQGGADETVVPFAALTVTSHHSRPDVWHASCDIGRRGAACFEAVSPSSSS